MGVLNMRLTAFHHHFEAAACGGALGTGPSQVPMATELLCLVCPEGAPFSNSQKGAVQASGALFTSKPGLP